MAFNDLYVETTPCAGVVCHEAPGRGKAVDTYDDWCRCETSMVFKGCFQSLQGASGPSVEDLNRAETASAAGDLFSILMYSKSI